MTDESKPDWVKPFNGQITSIGDSREIRMTEREAWIYEQGYELGQQAARTISADELIDSAYAVANTGVHGMPMNDCVIVAKAALSAIGITVGDV